MGARKSEDADNKPHKKKSKLKLKNADTKCTEESKVLAKQGKTKKSRDEKDLDNPDHADNKPHKKSKLKLKNADTKCIEEFKVLAKHGKTKKSRDEKDLDNPDHTIFVGNLPKDIEKKDVIKLFSQYGKIQSVRLRNAPIADTRTPKKVAVIKKEFHFERNNINAYVVFADADSAQKSLELNGQTVEDRHVRVAMLKAPPMDKNKAVFIGNLPFAADEEELQHIFETCGAITCVRIVRDKARGIGRGFAYINFETTEAVELALLKEGVKLQNRALRVQRCKEMQSSKQKLKNAKHKPSGTVEKSLKQNKVNNSQTRIQELKGLNDKSDNTSYRGQTVMKTSKIQKKKRNKIHGKKKEAVETLVKTMPGTTQIKGSKKFRYFNQKLN